MYYVLWLITQPDKVERASSGILDVRLYAATAIKDVDRTEVARQDHHYSVSLKDIPTCIRLRLLYSGI
jgi:hypothetical protein